MRYLNALLTFSLIFAASWIGVLLRNSNTEAKQKQTPTTTVTVKILPTTTTVSSAPKEGATSMLCSVDGWKFRTDPKSAEPFGDDCVKE